MQVVLVLITFFLKDKQTKLWKNTTKDLLDLHFHINLAGYLHPDRFGKAEKKKWPVLV